MSITQAKPWMLWVLCYWVLMAGIFFLEFRFMESDWAGLPGFLLTLPLSILVVAAGLLPAIAGRLGYDIPINFTSYHFEYGFIVCALLNAFILSLFIVCGQAVGEQRSLNLRRHLTTHSTGARIEWFSSIFL